MDLKKLLEKLIKKNNDKNTTDKNMVGNLLILLLVGILIVVAMSFFKTSNTTSMQNPATGSGSDGSNGDSKVSQQATGDNSESKDYESEIQDKLKDTLEKIDGVGKVEVMISFESGEEQVPAVNVNDSTSTTQEKDTQGGTRSTTQKNNGSTVVVTNDGSKSEPLIVKTYEPKVSGVCVVAEGAENKVTELRITKAVVDLFNIGEDKVNVYPMKK